MRGASASLTLSRTLNKANGGPEQPSTDNNKKLISPELDAEFSRAQDFKHPDGNKSKPPAEVATEVEALDQYAQDMLEHGTHCEWDLSGEELSGEEYVVYKKAKDATYAKTNTRRVASTAASHKDELEDDIDYGNLPLIDIWLARGRGYTQEEVSKMEGFHSTEKKQRGEGVPMIQANCDGRGSDVYDTYLNEFSETCPLMPLPDEEDANL
jgi:hypothetical protein